MRRLLLAILVSAPSLATFAAPATQFYGVAAGHRFAQTSTNLPSLLSAQAYTGRAFIFGSGVVSATVKKPNSQTAALANVGDHWEVSGIYDSPLALAGAWPPGTFALTNVNSIDGTKVSQMNLSSDSYPTAVRVSNFGEAQSISAVSPFVLKWEDQSSLQTNLIYLRIEENGVLVLETGKIPGLAGALNATANATGFTIPAGKLQEGHVYTCSITIWRAILKDTTTIPGAFGLTAYTAETTLRIRTRWNIQDVRYYGVEKRVNYLQTGAAPMPIASPFEVVSFADGSANDSMTAASFRLANATPHAMSAAGADFNYSQIFSTQGAMETAFPGGAYEVSMATRNNGTRIVSSTLAGNTYPDPPQVVNIDEAQFIKASQPFTLSWTINGASANDHLQFAINEGTNVVFATPFVIGAGALNGAQKSMIIPAGVLSAGKSYTGMLRLCRLTGSDLYTYPAATGQWAYARVTRFAMQTANGLSAAPHLQPPVRMGNQTQLTFSSTRGEKYTIYSSSDLRTFNSVQSLTGADSSTTVLLPANSLGAEFFRIVGGQ